MNEELREFLETPESNRAEIEYREHPDQWQEGGRKRYLVFSPEAYPPIGDFSSSSMFDAVMNFDFNLHTEIMDMADSSYITSVDVAQIRIFLFAASIMHWSHRGYTLKRDGWHRTFTDGERPYSVYQFSRIDGIRLVDVSEVPF